MNFRVLLFLVLVALSACTLQPQVLQMSYPENWAQLQKDHTACDTFTGNYSFHAEEAQHIDGYAVPNFFSLFRRVAPDALVFHLSTNAAHTELQAATSTAHMVLPVLCNDGSLIFVHRESGHGDGVTSTLTTTSTLSIASDGSLVVRVVGKAHSDDLLFRWGKEFDVLYKFQAELDPNNKNTENSAQH